MNIPTHIDFSNDKQNDLEIDLSNINNVNGILSQVKYKEILNDGQKRIYKGYCCCLCDCCCCRKSKNRYKYQFLIFYYILLFLIITAYTLRIGPLKKYNFIRNKILGYIKTFSLSTESSFFENNINITYNYKYNYYDDNDIEEYRLMNPFPFVNFFCDYNKFLNKQCNRSEYERDNGCNFHNLKKRKCIFKEYVKCCNLEYINNNNYKNNKTYYCDCVNGIISNNTNNIPCINYPRNEICNKEQYDYFYYKNYLYEKNIPGYIIDYNSIKYFCVYQIYEKVIFIFSLMLLFCTFIFYLIYIYILKNKNSSENIYYYTILIILMILYIIFSIISILFCYFFVYTLFLHSDNIQFFANKYNYYTNRWDKYIKEIIDNSKILVFDKYDLMKIFLIILSNFSWVISIFSLFLLIPIKRLIISHINLENNELNEKYKKSTFYIKDKIFDVEIKIDDELVLKSEEKYFLFKEVKIKEIKSNDNIYILVNNEYIKDQLRIDLKLYKKNIQIGRLRDLINLIIVILIFLIGLFQIFSINNYIFIFYNDENDKFENYNRINGNNFYDLSYYPINYRYLGRERKLYFQIYPTSFEVYKYFEYYIEISEFLICLIMLFSYCFCFFKRLFTGGIKTQYQINIYKSIFKIFIVFNFIYMFLSKFLLVNGFIIYGLNYEHILTPFHQYKLLIHSILNSIIMVLYIVIIVKNFRLIKYINNIEKEMNLINGENNNPKKLEFIDLYNLKHTLKPIIYNNYKMNLFYELEGEKLKNKMNKEGIDSEINDLEK